MHIKKRNGYIISGVMLFALTLITLFVIFLFMHPTVYFSKASGFSQHDGVRAGKNKLRLVVPETVDTTKSTYISVKQEWFETSRMGRITDIKVKPGKHLALDFTDREYNKEVFTIYTKNWFGIKREHDVIVDYSNFLRVFFPESQDGVAPRKPVILPYSKLQTEYKHIYEELYKMKGFMAFNEKGEISAQSVSKEEVFIKENARGRAFIVNNNTHISLVYDFVLPGIFKNQAQKTQVYDLVEKVMGKAKTLDPESQGLEIKLNTPPFYISKFLGWYYIDPVGNRVDLKPGEEFLIPQWVKSELRLIAKYDITTDTDKIGPELDKQGLVAVSYFDGAERVFFDIVKKGSPLKEHVYQKPGYTYEGWYRDSSLTEKVNFAYEVASSHTVLYLKSIKQNQPGPEKPVKYHTVNFITPSDANQLLSTKRAHGQKLETNYLTPSLVSRLDEHGNLWELDYWNLVDPITGTRTRFDFNTQITEDITLEAVMRKRIPATSKYTIKRYYESVDQADNFIEDKSKEEVVDGQTPGQEVELSPTQTNAPTGFTLAKGTVTKKTIAKDGSTVFELKYIRRRYKVNFEVNYNGNHFKDVNASLTPEQTIPYEGKLTKPTNPTITKAGYTYIFKHWQLKDEMGNVYKEVSEFDFNTKITKNLTLVAYFEEKKDIATYTVKHIFQGIQNQIDERVEEKKFTEQVGKSITVTQENRDKSYDEHFEVADFLETKKVEADGSTVFEIRYARKKYKVNFEVNYNNHFAGANASSEPAQTIAYQGKVRKPEFSPSLAKPGHNYTFKHWQLKDDMGNVYREVSAFDFDNSQITKNTTLVAYFEENIQTAKYTIKHIYKGLVQSQDIVELETKNAQVGSSVTVSEANSISKPGFEIKPQSQTKTIQANGQTTFTLTYERKTYLVEYNYNSGTLNGQTQTSETYKFEEVLRDIDHPQKTDPAQLKEYTFAGWQDEATGEMIDFSQNIKVVQNLKLKAIWQEATSTRPVYLKMIWEKINEPQDIEVEQKISAARTIGATAQITDADIQAALNQFISNNPHPNHESNFDAANSVPSVTITTSTDKHYITVYFKARTYTVNFDRSEILNSSVDNQLKQPIVLKYSQVLPADLIAKMKAVKKASTANKDYVFSRLIETNSNQTFQEGIAYNKDITLKPEFQEKDVLVDVTPKVAAHDADKADASQWEVQTGKVGDTFNYQPMVGVKKGWRLVGWSKTNGGIAENIQYTRDLKEVYAVFAPAETTYTIKHIFKGIPEDNIADVEHTTTKNALTNLSVQLTNGDKYHDYDENGFDAQLPPTAQTIKADGSTEFTITYVRREFTVTFKVNYNNQFPGTAGNIPSRQKVKFEGKVKPPTPNPTITKDGRTYLFKHWQLESSMNGTYSEQQPYDFTSPVKGDVSLVAYFKETIHRVTYKIVHYLEKTGKDSALNGQYEGIEEVKTDQKVEDGAHYQDYAQLDSQLYEKHTTHPQNKLTAKLTAGDNTVEVCQYYKLKEVEVKFKKTEGIASFTYDTLKVKKTRSVALPRCTLKNTHNFIGWALSENGQTQSEFVVEKTTSSLEILAKTDFQNRDITYTIKKEKVDGNFEDPIVETKSGKIGSVHTVAYLNPDDSTYQSPVYDKSSLTVNADANQNKVTVTLKRKVYEVTFEVKGHSSSIAKRTIRHGAAIGAIDESQFAAQSLGIRKAELDGKEKTKKEIENYLVQKNHKVTLHIDKLTKKFGAYPQTKVDNPAGIKPISDEIHELKFNSKAKDYSMLFTRSYWQDTDGNKYEKYNGEYFKFEDVEFVKIPKLNTWFTEKIIDFSPFNIYYNNYSDNAKPEHSIFKALVEDIGKVLGGEVYMPTYDNGDFSVKPALDANLHSQLKKESTDYAKTILGSYLGEYVGNYRGVDLSTFVESSHRMPYYHSNFHQYWWLGTQYPDSEPYAHSITFYGRLDWHEVYHVFGVVVCIR